MLKLGKEYTFHNMEDDTEQDVMYIECSQSFEPAFLFLEEGEYTPIVDITVEYKISQ